MKFFPRMTALALAGVLSLCLLSGCQQQGGVSSPDPVPEVVDVAAIDDICLFLTGLPADEVVAKTDELEITAGELIYWVTANSDRLRNSYYYYYGTDRLPWGTTDDSGKTSFADYILAEAVKNAVTQRLVDTKGRQAGLVPTQENLDAIQTALDTIHTAVLARDLPVQTYLFQQGLTEDLFRWNCECDYIYEAIALSNFGPDSSNPPTEENIRAFLESQGKYKVKHILLATIDTSTRQPLDEQTAAAKKAKATELLEALRASEDPMTLFDEYMNTLSEDPGLANSPDGYVFTANTTVDPAFEQVALALEHGQISDVVDGASGYHIILRLPLDVDVKEDAETYIYGEMSLLADGWTQQSGYKTTKALHKLNAQTIYERLLAYRDAVAALAEPATEQTPE